MRRRRGRAARDDACATESDEGGKDLHRGAGEGCSCERPGEVTALSMLALQYPSWEGGRSGPASGPASGLRASGPTAACLTGRRIPTENDESRAGWRAPRRARPVELETAVENAVPPAYV